MGQYYNCIVKRDYDENGYYNGKTYTHEISGAKLLEFCYLESEELKELAKFMHNKPCRLAFVGDYAYEHPLYGLAYLEGYELPKLADKFNLSFLDYTGKFFINHDKKCFIDLDKYRQENANDDWTIHPFILCAVGNGRGGGDYPRCSPDFAHVGSWAWDSVEINDIKPMEYSEEMYYFKE